MVGEYIFLLLDSGIGFSKSMMDFAVELTLLEHSFFKSFRMSLFIPSHILFYFLVRRGTT